MRLVSNTRSNAVAIAAATRTCAPILVGSAILIAYAWSVAQNLRIGPAVLRLPSILPGLMWLITAALSIALLRSIREIPAELKS